MLNGRKLTVGTAADTPCRRIGRDKLGKLILNIGKLPHHLVVFKILNLGIILDIVFVAVVVKEIPQLLCAFT